MVTGLLIVSIFVADFFKRNAVNKNSKQKLIINVVEPTVTTTDDTEVSDQNTGDQQNPGYVEAQIDESLYYRTEKSKSELCVGELAIINPQNTYVFPDTQSSMEKIYDNMTGNDYKVAYLTLTAHKSILSSLNSMMADFFSLYKHNDVTITNSFVSYASQNDVYVSPPEGKAFIETEKSLAPGQTEHHTGYAIDLTLVDHSGRITAFDGSGDYEWIVQNCYKYGFVLRYPEGKEHSTGMAYQPNHFRYVGTPHSYIMDENGFTLEEYVNHLKQYVYGYEHLRYELYGYMYEIYYVPLSSESETTIVPVPSDRSYTISGNNIDGFIVTICSKAST